MNKKILSAIVVIAVLAVLGVMLMSPPEENSTEQIAINNAAMISEVETAAGDMTSESKEIAEEISPAVETDAKQATEKAGLNIDDILAQRAMGNPEAPVVIEEFASLTCSHCGHFYRDTFPQIKAEYIDTGKVYFIYTDFPLNAPAMEGTIVARCLPQDKYFNFIKFLFKTQDDWAYEANYGAYLKQNAKLLGLTEDTYEACMNSDAIKKGITKSMQEKSQAHNIRSTPSFVINGSAQIVGARPFETFQKVIEEQLARTGSAPAESGPAE